MLWPCVVMWVHTNILEEQAASTFRVEVSHTWIKINYAQKMAYVNGGQAGTAFKQGPENTVFKENPCNGHWVKKNKPNEVHAFSIYSLLWFFQGVTKRNPWPIQVKIIFLFAFLGGSMKSASLVIQTMNLPEDSGSTFLWNVGNHIKQRHSVISQNNCL